MPQPQIVEIPGIGEVEFPDTMSDAEITAEATRLYESQDLLVQNVQNLGRTAKDLTVGALKGVGNTAIGLGEMVAPALRQIPGVRDYVATPEQFSAARAAFTTPTNTAQSIGRTVEQGLEFAVPVGAARRAAVAMAPQAVRAAYGGLIPLVAAEAASAAGVAKAQGGNPGTAALLSAAIPIAGKAASGVAGYAKDKAVRWAQGAVKPTVTAMKQTAGASRAGVDSVAHRLARFIVERRLTTPEKAQRLVTDAESTLQSLVGTQPTGAATRAARYLQALEASAAKQGLGADDVAAIQRAAGELLEGPMGTDVISHVTTLQPSAILGPSGRPVMVPVVTPQSTRALRSTVPADEALASARASSQWGTRRSWGEQKGAAMEASKAVERAQRDAVKAAVPAARPVFGDYANALKAREVLQRMALRQGNRDVVGLPAHAVAAGEIARGRVPVLSAIVNWIRDNQLPAGIAAHRVGSLLQDPNLQSAAAALSRLGIAHAANPDLEAELLKRSGAY